MKWVFMVGVIVSGLFMSIWINNPESIEIQDWEKEQKIPSLYDKQMESWGYKSLNIQGNKVHKRIIKIAIIDSGIDKSHPDIKGIVTKEYNAINPNNEIIDDTGHGTAVAGIIGAIDNKPTHSTEEESSGDLSNLFIKEVFYGKKIRLRKVIPS